uniref:Uncharacterized protein n=1 Tax=Candidatus Methanophaga sp. ANME-1 ERB7 TaxID=2759913 RepID=A0A7G9ZAH4_9EURY|nr:hypothetical protein HCLJFGEB_00002 [Methanosarcinales archaeon ANME-1 ERB7]
MLGKIGRADLLRKLFPETSIIITIEEKDRTRITRKEEIFADVEIKRGRNSD